MVKTVEEVCGIGNRGIASLAFQKFLLFYLMDAERIFLTCW